ncbi:MAG: hypothetical protein RLZZ148_2102 [Cyanobacteriota bacterium]
MKGIQYIVDETGEKTAVVIDLKELNEDWINRSPFREKLDQALTWNANHRPQLSYLESLESKLENNEC